MNVGSTRATHTSLSWCPNCDLPLRRRANTLSGTLSWRTTLGEPVDACPRCLEWLPTVRPELEVALDETNDILAEMGEPPTCAEELERAGVRPWAEGSAA